MKGYVHPNPPEVEMSKVYGTKLFEPRIAVEWKASGIYQVQLDSGIRREDYLVPGDKTTGKGAEDDPRRLPHPSLDSD